MHEEMTGLSTRASHRIIPGVEHLNLVTRRENAVHVASAVLEMVAQIRTEVHDAEVAVSA